MNLPPSDDVRVYRAASMREALRLVREELGVEATIVSAEARRTKGWFGKSRSEGVEVRAIASEAEGEPSRDESTGIANTKDPSLAAAPRTSPRRFEVFVDDVPREAAVRNATGKSASIERHSDAKILASRRILTQALARAEFPATAIEAELDTLFASVSDDEAKRPEALLPILARRLADGLRVERGALPLAGGSLRIALVGATGVGKTTTTAKLAARYALDRRLRVGLIGVDTYRMGAVDQLEHYAQLLGIELRIATSPAEMKRATLDLSECDVVLVDTAGRSPLDADSVGELAGILDAGAIDHVWIVAGASTHAGAFASAIDKLAPLAPTGLVLTKLDEQVACGHLWPTLSTTELPIFYLADGQRVPEDLTAADARRLARALLGAPGDVRRAIDAPYGGPIGPTYTNSSATDAAA